MKNLLLRLCLAVQLLVLAASCAHAPGSPQASTATIQYPRLADEISNQQVNTFAEDAQGHIWIGTFRGLNKYDAYEYQQYYCMDDSLGPQDNQIKALLRDSHGRLWVSSVSGLSYYTDHDTFHHIPSDLKNKNGVQLIEMRDGRILVNTITSLGIYNPQSGRLEYAIRQLTVPGVYTARCYADAGNRLWVADITYVDTDEGVAYLHLLTDAFTHEIIGWRLSDSLKASNTVAALRQAIDTVGRFGMDGLIHHSDRGAQYCSSEYTDLLRSAGVRISMTEDYNPTDNAVAERVNGIIKQEWLYRMKRPASVGEAERTISRIVRFYNDVRPHMNNIGRMPPGRLRRLLAGT